MTTPKKIYLILGHYHYESTRVLGAFKRRSKAEKMLAACRAFLAASPPPIEGDLYQVPDAEIVAWNAKDEEWRKSHPLKCCPHDSYTIQEIEVTP